MIVAGVMSGTSADGVDVAICRIGPGTRTHASPRVKLIGHIGKSYPKAIRAVILRVMEGEPLPAAEMSRLNWRLGQIYADCIQQTAEKFAVQPALIGCHGQTIHHEPTPTKFLGAPVSSTWQIGEPAVIAQRLHCPVVSDFRPADLAAGGQGAPLVPMLDFCIFRSAKVGRVLLNLGGIANLTAIPAGAELQDLLAFDTGPANMVIDHCMATLYAKQLDRNGTTAQRGRILPQVLARLMQQPYFSTPPPKSCGREQFGAAFATRLIGLCRDTGCSGADCIATATALTAASVLAAYRNFVSAHLRPNIPVELCVAGGGANNRTLMDMLRNGFAELGVSLRPIEDLGIPAQAKEAVAFALLAWLTWHGLPGNVPAATGATHPAVLGKVSYG
jgi:anhydro-N-acetylmuramic acid kinase